MLFARMFFVLFFLTTVVFAFTSEVVVFPSDKIQGEGPFPYNYRIIDDHIHAGGHPLNPKNNLRNNDEQALHILKYLKSKPAEPPSNLPQTGIILGKNTYRGEERIIRVQKEDRSRHVYMIGQTGTGKSTLMKSWIQV